MRREHAGNTADDLRGDVQAGNGRRISRRNANAILTAGLKCAPDTGPNVRINTARMAPVGSVLQRSASAPLPPASLAAMMPLPTTAASKKRRSQKLGNDALR